MGYSRIGFATDHAHSARNEHRWLAAFQAYAQTQGSRKVVFLPPYLPHQVKDATFYRWLDLHQPDAVVISRGYFVDLIKNSGRRVPQDIGIAWLSIDAGVADVSGVDEQSEIIGELAVDLLGRLIARGLKGIPQTPEGLNVDGVWVPGATLRTLQ